MMSALNEVGQPCAPLNGVYYRMEDDDVQKRFNNGFRMEILNDVAHVEKGKGKRRKSYICKLTDDEDALIIDWSSVDPPGAQRVCNMVAWRPILGCWRQERNSGGWAKNILQKGLRIVNESCKQGRATSLLVEQPGRPSFRQSRATSVVVQKPRWMLT